MSILKRVLAVFLMLTALAAGVNWIATPLYDNSSGYPVWVILDWPIALGVVIVLVVNFLRKRDLDSNGSGASVTRKYLEVNIAFYASLLLTLWFYWNWFYSLFPDNEPDAVEQIHLMMWAFIIPVLSVPVMGATGFHLWRDAEEA